MNNAQLAIVGLQVFAIIIGGLIAYYGFVVKVNGRLDKIESWIEQRKEILSNDRLKEMDARLSKLQSDGDVFWKVIEPHLANIIHSPIHRDRDTLVEKLVCGTLTGVETYALVTELRIALDDPDWPPDKKLAGALLLARVLATHDQRRSDEHDC
jgi:hypothetical protein